MQLPFRDDSYFQVIDAEFDLGTRGPELLFLISCFSSALRISWSISLSLSFQQWMHVQSLQSCATLCDPVNCSLPGSSVHGIFQARILEWVVISFSRGVFLTQVSLRLLLCRWILYHWSTGEAPLLTKLDIRYMVTQKLAFHKYLIRVSKEDICVSLATSHLHLISASLPLEIVINAFKYSLIREPIPEVSNQFIKLILKILFLSLYIYNI